MLEIWKVLSAIMVGFINNCCSILNPEKIGLINFICVRKGYRA